MNKETIEVYRHKKHLNSYSLWLHSDHKDHAILKSDGSPRHETIMNLLCDFTKDKNITVYSHELKVEDVIKPEYGTYKSDNFNGEIPYCDRVYTLDIYYQEKL